ncbi:hypothetical protein EBR21_03315 [bacterium]|nr:hypothetical protein [bacterium]
MLRRACIEFARRWTLLAVCFFLVSGCGPVRCGARVDISPEDQLNNYITLAVNITRMDQREELENLTTGEFRDHLTSSSPEAFKKAYLDRRYDFDAYEVISKSEVEAGREIQLEYRMKFRTWLTGEDNKRAPVQEIRSLATMKYTNGQWAIASIKPLDSEYNWDVGLPLEGVSTQGITPDSPVVDPYAEEADGAVPAAAVPPASAPVEKKK